MITISAFADEISPDLEEQMDVCESHGIKHIDVRGINDRNVSTFTLAEVADYKRQMDDRGFAVPCVGSPLGKIKISDDFDAHLELLKHCCDVARAFDTDKIRMFSFYPTDGMNIEDQRSEVMDRLAAMVDVAEKADIILLHENEKAIYGAKPAGVLDIFQTIKSDHLLGIFDPANYVEEGIAPYDAGWREGLADVTQYLHIKDKVPGSQTCVPAGEGEGQFKEIFADLKARNWSGYATLEPHMAAAGQFSGFTGSALFDKAATALKSICEATGHDYK